MDVCIRCISSRSIWQSIFERIWAFKLWICQSADGLTASSPWALNSAHYFQWYPAHAEEPNTHFSINDCCYHCLLQPTRIHVIIANTDSFFFVPWLRNQKSRQSPHPPLFHTPLKTASSVTIQTKCLENLAVLVVLRALSCNETEVTGGSVGMLTVHAKYLRIYRLSGCPKQTLGLHGSG